MGSWGTRPLENDGALDLKDEWKDTKDVSVLENALDTVLSLEEEEGADAMDAEAAVAAVYIVVNEDFSSLPIHKDLLQKSAAVLGRIVENSELKDLWAETDSFGDWLSSITELMQRVLECLQALDK